MDDRLTGIAVFVQAADAGSFAQAASRLGQTRSAVAKAIARLEQRLGARLFHRTTRRQALTDEGQAYYDHCRRALDALAQAEDALMQGRHEASGRLRVAAPLALGRELVAPVLLELLAAHPRLELDLQLSDRVVDLVGEGVDLAVRIGELPDSSALAARRLGTQCFAYYAAARARRDTGIAYRLPESEPWVDAQGAPLALEIRMRCDDLHALLGACRAGQGIVRLPRWLAAGQALECVAEAPASMHASVHAAWPASRHLPLRTRIAIDALAAALPARLDP